MALYELTPKQLSALQPTTFAAEGIRERDDLQRYIADNITTIDSDLLVLCDEFDEWEESKRRMDLLCLDRAGRLVVIELKRTQDGGHMELQAIRYAAMISNMTMAEAVRSHARYRRIDPIEARTRILDHLDDPEANEDDFGNGVAIVLVSADFSKELMASVLWLNQHELDIRCVRLRPFRLDDRVIVQSEQVVPLPEAEHFQFRMRAKDAERRRGLQKGGWTGTWFANVGEDKRSCRSWEDCQRYGYLSAGGGRRFQEAISRPGLGDLVFAYISRHGYVGCGKVIGPAMPYDAFEVRSVHKLLLNLPKTNPISESSSTRKETQEYCLPVEWLATRDRDNAIRDEHRRGTCIKIHDPSLIARLMKSFGVELEEASADD